MIGRIEASAARGVRSWWAASALNRLRLATLASMRPIISFRVSERRSSSSPEPVVGRRSSRLLAPIARAFPVISRMGRRLPRASHQPIRPVSTTTMGSARRKTSRMWPAEPAKRADEIPTWR